MKIWTKGNGYSTVCCECEKEHDMVIMVGWENGVALCRPCLKKAAKLWQEHDKSTLLDTGISQKWKKVAKNWVGNDGGRHCHWCKHIVDCDGSSCCGHKDSCYFNDRIRTWDGEGCAKRCKLFELSDWYRRDENFDKSFTQKE